jgi:hypothetical protein
MHEIAVVKTCCSLLLFFKKYLDENLLFKVATDEEDCCRA